MSEYINKKQEEAREFYEDELCCLSPECEKSRQTIERYNDFIETTIKDTLQTLLDSEEMQRIGQNVTFNAVARDDLKKASEISGHNQAITAIRNKITSMLDNQQ